MMEETINPRLLDIFFEHLYRPGAFVRNLCLRCGRSVDNITAIVCDECRDKQMGTQEGEDATRGLTTNCNEYARRAMLYSTQRRYAGLCRRDARICVRLPCQAV